MSLPLALEVSENVQVLLVGQAFIFLGTIVALVAKQVWDVSRREQDRLDRESEAKTQRNEIAKVFVEGKRRELRLTQAVEASRASTVHEARLTRAVNEEQIKVSNNVNGKIESLGLKLIEERERKPV